MTSTSKRGHRPSLGQFDAGDIETIVRTLQAIAERAAWEAAQE